jgi:hypothetical protein
MDARLAAALLKEIVKKHEETLLDDETSRTCL